MFGSHPSYKIIWIHCSPTLIATCLPPVTFRCSIRRLLSINALQTDGSSAVSVWLLTRFRRWIRGGIAVQVLAWVSSNFERCYSVLFRDFDVSKVPVSLPLYEVLLLTWLWAKIVIFDGWMMDFCWVCKELSSKKRSAIVKWFVWTQLIEEDILGYYKKQGRVAKCPTSFSLFIVLAMSLKVITGTFNGGIIHQNITDE